MKVFQRIVKFCAAFALVGLAVLSNLNPVFADDETPEYGISISPVVIDLEQLKPGEITDGKFTIKNTGKNDNEFKIEFQPYSVEGEDYTSTIGTATKYNDIINWATFSETEGSLASGESKDIEFTIRVPKDVPAGGQYGVITAEASGKNDDSAGASISVGRQVGVIVYAEVAGQTRVTGSIDDVKVPGILFNPPITATSVVENTGNTHVTATYTLQVFPLFGDEEVYTNEEKPETSLILPETRRFNSISWDGAPHLGIFRVKYTVSAFGENKVTEKVVFLCPIWFLFIILLVIFCIIFWVVTRIRARKQN